MKKDSLLPELPLQEWENTKMTLHLILQIMGKVRLKRTLRKNHWWFITLYVSPKGFTTTSMPCQHEFNVFEITLNVHLNQIELTSSLNKQRTITVYDGRTISSFYKEFTQCLKEINIIPDINDRPIDLGIDTRFSGITE